MVEKTDKIDKIKEAALWERMAAGDDAAREELILAYRPLVFWLAQKFKVPYALYGDLVQEGMLALIKGVDKFDLSRNNKFITYAYYRVKGQMINYLQRVEAKAPLPVEDIYAYDFSEQGDAELDMDLSGALKQLSQSEAYIVSSMVFMGVKAADLSQEKGVDVSQIYRIKRRALGKLKEWLLKESALNQQ